jgi:hypothetical protein
MLRKKRGKYKYMFAPWGPQEQMGELSQRTGGQEKRQVDRRGGNGILTEKRD